MANRFAAGMRALSSLNAPRKLQTYSHYEGLPSASRGAVMALGNFDGLHRGHQGVIVKAREMSHALKAPLAIGVFSPHPYRYFKPEAPPFRLMSDRVRSAILSELGVERLYELPFTDTLRDMDDATFVQTVLAQGLGLRHVIVGEDFVFGKNRCGNIESLKNLCERYNIGVSTLPPVSLHEAYGKYGSTEIRQALQRGDVFQAAHMLSRPWVVDGIVKKGEQRGRTIGFPTANIDFGSLIHPKFGVYAVEVKIEGDDKIHTGVANAGLRPTVGGETPRLEVHIFDYDQDIYGRYIDVAFRTFIRAEQKFENFAVLQAQIKQDAKGARAIFGLLD